MLCPLSNTMWTLKGILKSNEMRAWSSWYRKGMNQCYFSMCPMKSSNRDNSLWKELTQRVPSCLSPWGPSEGCWCFGGRWGWDRPIGSQSILCFLTQPQLITDPDACSEEQSGTVVVNLFSGAGLPGCKPWPSSNGPCGTGWVMWLLSASVPHLKIEWMLVSSRWVTEIK